MCCRLCDVKLKTHLQDFSLKRQNSQHPAKEDPPRELFSHAQPLRHLKSCYSPIVQGGSATPWADSGTCHHPHGNWFCGHAESEWRGPGGFHQGFGESMGGSSTRDTREAFMCICESGTQVATEMPGSWRCRNRRCLLCGHIGCKGCWDSLDLSRRNWTLSCET